jgi:ribosomal protein L11 methyltransferase
MIKESRRDRMANEYRRFWTTSSTAIDRECLLAEAFDAGAEGAEEVEEKGTYRACIYATSARIESLHDTLRDAFSAETLFGSIERMPDVDWSQAWKEGLDAIVISERLLIRPPFVSAELRPGQKEIVIDPGQAFGIGGHASTRLCLEWIDELYRSSAQDRNVGRYDRVLDVGTGSGVLALAALALGADRAVGFDLDEVAILAAKEAAVLNQFSSRVHFFTGPISTVRESGEKFPLVLVNLLKQEMLPIALEIASVLDQQGRLILAGLLEEDVAEVKPCFEQFGLCEVGRRSLRDSTGEWVGLCLKA